MPKRKVEELIFPNNPEMTAFHKQHGDYVQIDNVVIFADGANYESTGLGHCGLNPPSEDEYERAQFLAAYWGTKADAAEKEFFDYKDFLNGNGMGVEGIYGEEAKLEYLKKLKAKATTAKRKFGEARKEVKATEPFWLKQKRAEKQEDIARKTNFKNRVDQIKL